MGQQLLLGLQLKASARFSNFVAGANSELVEQLQRSADGTGEAVCFCWGGTGAGKTHLLQASCHRAAARQRSAAYVSLRDRSGLDPGLLEGWEGFNLVCVDDIDAAAGDSQWEEALFHLYNRLRESGARLVASARLAPSKTGITLPDLVSRLASGVVYQIKPLNDQQRLQAMQLRARQKGYEMPDDTANYLLKRMPRDMPALFDLLDRLDEASLIAQRKLTIPFVKSVLGL